MRKKKTKDRPRGSKRTRRHAPHPKVVAKAGRTKATKRRRQPSEKQRMKRKVTAALAEINIELFRTRAPREAYASIRMEDHFETYPIDSAEFKDWAWQYIYVTLGEIPKPSVLTDVILHMKCEALFGVKVKGTKARKITEHPVFHRIAEVGGNIYLDLCDPGWQVIEITPTGWSVAKNPPVRFTRSPTSRALPLPVLGGNLHDIFQFVNITRRDHQVLFLSWLVGATQTRTEYPILMANGSQGSAKTTACRIAAALIDPADPQLVGEYKSGRDLMVASKYSHVMAVDNVSEITDRMSDAFCRLSTGSAGTMERQLYTNNKISAISAKRPLLLNGITQTATRGDILDRMVALRLEAVTYRPGIFQEFEAARPALLGALLTVVSAALRNWRGVKIENPPRMVDFATWVVAAERELGFTEGEFLKAYRANRQDLSDVTLEFSPIGHPLMRLIDANNHGNPAGSWQGSIKDLFRELGSSHDPGWPKNEKAVAGELHRIEANLSAAGYAVKWLGKDSVTRRRIVLIEKKKKKKHAPLNAPPTASLPEMTSRT